MIDTLLLRPSLHLAILRFFPFKLHPTNWTKLAQKLRMWDGLSKLTATLMVGSVVIVITAS
jgi:hypothetical protein